MLESKTDGRSVPLKAKAAKGVRTMAADWEGVQVQRRSAERMKHVRTGCQGTGGKKRRAADFQSTRQELGE